MKDSPSEEDDKTLVDDDGVAIFWDKEKYRAVELGFLKHPDSKKKSEAIVAVVLEEKKTKKLINVLSAHFPSGAEEKKEKERLDVLKNNKKWTYKHILLREKSESDQPKKSIWVVDNYGDDAKFDGIVSYLKHYVGREKMDLSKTIFPTDVNSKPEFPLTTLPSPVDVEDGVLTDGKTNAWKFLQSIPNFECVWVQSKILAPGGNSINPPSFPISVNKMRGPSSDQPDKIGEHQCELTDHIFTSYCRSKVIDKVTLRSTKIEVETAPKMYESEEGKAEQELYPTMIMPSDHLPVIVDIELAQTASS